MSDAAHDTPNVKEIDHLERLLASYAKIPDGRRPGDSKRAGRFRSGWRHATDPNKRGYGASALGKITWQNLGYRLGTELGDHTESWIHAVYEHVAEIWDGAYFAPTEDDAVLDERADEYAELIEDGAKIYEGEEGPAPRSTVTTASFRRSPRVKGAVKRLAGGICELCDRPAPFMNRSGKPYLEVHHVIALEEDGPDHVSNAVAICPNCHRRCHYAADAADVVETLFAKVARLRRPEPRPFEGT